MKVKGYGVGIECGQKLWRKRSWRRWPSSDNLFRFRTWSSTFGKGFAFGPVMFFHDIKDWRS